MTSTRPYLIEAMYYWIIDNDKIPYIVINANHPEAQVPEDYVDNGRIILNISPEACRGLHIELDRIVFTARFSGVAMQIYAPPEAVIAIYAKENGRGMVFGDEDLLKEEIQESESEIELLPFGRAERKNVVKPQKRPKLKLVK